MGPEKYRLKVISDMIKSLSVNQSIQQTDYEFICMIGSHLSLNQDLIDELIKEDEIFILPKNMSSKLIHFYRMAVLNKRKKKSYFKWLRVLYKEGLALGLPPETIRNFLYDFHFCKNFTEGERVINMYFSK